jgi:hypothetical protein
VIKEPLAEDKSFLWRGLGRLLFAKRSLPSDFFEYS